MSKGVKHLNTQSDKNFMKTMDFGFMLKQIKEQIIDHENNINILNQKISDLQKQLNSGNKQQLVLQMKNLGSRKNILLNEISRLVKLIDRQNNGLRVKLSRMSKDKVFEKAHGAKGFVDYVSDIAVNNPHLKTKFQEKMASNFDLPYLSDYAKQLARQVRLDETSGDIYEKITSLPSFHNRNSKLVEKIFKNDLVNDEIQSYLKRVEFYEMMKAVYEFEDT